MYAIIAVGHCTRSDDIERGMPLSHLESIHDKTMWGEVHYHLHWTEHMIGRYQALHARKALGQLSWSDHVDCGMPLSPLGSRDGRTMSAITCHHCPWAAHKVRRRRACYAIIALGKHTRSYYIGRGMASSPLGCTNGHTSSGVACLYLIWTSHIEGRRRA